MENKEKNSKLAITNMPKPRRTRNVKERTNQSKKEKPAVENKTTARRPKREYGPKRTKKQEEIQFKKSNLKIIPLGGL